MFSLLQLQFELQELTRPSRFSPLDMLARQNFLGGKRNILSLGKGSLTLFYIWSTSDYELLTLLPHLHFLVYILHRVTAARWYEKSACNEIQEKARISGAI